MDCYKILGIEPTRDIKEIKKAYAKLLPLNNPEKDPESFQLLRSAYEKAIAKINEDVTSDNKNSLPIDEFMMKFEECYNNFEKRIDLESWKMLLESNICFQIDTSNEVSDRILLFIMEHYYFPSEVWMLLNKHFSWSTKKEKLYNQFSKNFIDYVVNKTIYRNYFRYENLLKCKENKQEQFMVEYSKACTALDEYNLYSVGKSINICKEICPEHPDLLNLLSKFLIANGESDEALKLITSVINQDNDDIFAHITRGHHLFRIGKNEEAYEDYKKAISLYPDSIEVLFSLGRCCTILKKYEEAISYLEILIKLSQNSREAHSLLLSAQNFQLDYLIEMLKGKPDDLELKIKLAKMYCSTGKPNESYEILSELEKNNQLDCEMYSLFCNILLILGKKELAYTTSCKVISMFPDKQELYAIQALTLDELGNYVESVKVYDIAICLKPDDAISYNNKSYSLNKLNRFTEAIESANRAILIDSQMAASYKNKAEALLGLQLYQECLEACDEALNLNLYLTDVYVIKMKLFARIPQYEEALIIFTKADDLGLRNSKLLYEKANIFRLTSRYEEAIYLYDSIIEMDEENFDSYYCKGLCYFNKELYVKAVENFEQSILHNNNTENAYYYKILSLMNTQKDQEALDDLDIVIKMNTINRDKFHELRGDILFKSNKIEESIAEYKNAIEKNSDYSTYYYNIGKSLNKLKKYDEAIKYLDLAIEKDSSMTNAYIDKSFALYHIGKYIECSGVCDIVLKLDPSYAMAYQNKAWALYMAGKFIEAEKFCNEGLKIDRNHANLLGLHEKLMLRNESVKNSKNMKLYFQKIFSNIMIFLGYPIFIISLLVTFSYIISHLFYGDDTNGDVIGVFGSFTIISAIIIYCGILLKRKCILYNRLINIIFDQEILKIDEISKAISILQKKNISLNTTLKYIQVMIDKELLPNCYIDTQKMMIVTGFQLRKSFLP